ncbi:DUF6421 family protein, partial [Micrococcus luteus]
MSTFLSLPLIHFTPPYHTNSTLLFPQTVAIPDIPTFTSGPIFHH